jgi:hypothetical protein
MILLVCVYIEAVYHFESNERLGKILYCVTKHTICNLILCLLMNCVYVNLIPIIFFWKTVSHVQTPSMTTRMCCGFARFWYVVIGYLNGVIE